MRTGSRRWSGRLRGRSSRRRDRLGGRDGAAGQTTVYQRERRDGRRTGKTAATETVSRLSRTSAVQFRVQHGNRHEVQHNQERTAQRAQTATETGKSAAAAAVYGSADSICGVAQLTACRCRHRRRHRRWPIPPVVDVEPRVLNVLPPPRRARRSCSTSHRSPARRPTTSRAVRRNPSKPVHRPFPHRNVHAFRLHLTTTGYVKFKRIIKP